MTLATNVYLFTSGLNIIKEFVYTNYVYIMYKLKYKRKVLHVFFLYYFLSIQNSHSRQGTTTFHSWLCIGHLRIAQPTLHKHIYTYTHSNKNNTMVVHCTQSTFSKSHLRLTTTLTLVKKLNNSNNNGNKYFQFLETSSITTIGARLSIMCTRENRLEKSERFCSNEGKRNFLYWNICHAIIIYYFLGHFGEHFQYS